MTKKKRILKLTLPDWIDEKTNLFLVGGNEVIARNVGSRGWEIKTSRCNQCGECCKGKCDHLKETAPGYFVCGNPDGQPWACVRGSGEDLGEKVCSIRFERVPCR